MGIGFAGTLITEPPTPTLEEQARPLVQRSGLQDRWGENAMPLVSINLRKARPPEVKRAIADAVHAALVANLRIPETDRFQLIREYESADFVHSEAHLDLTYSSDLITFEISFVAGRSDEIKKALLKDLNERLVANAGLRPDDVFVTFHNVDRANVSFGKGVAQRAL